MEVTREEMIDTIVERRKEYFDEELKKYKETISNLSNDKLEKVYKTIIKKE